MSFLKALSGSGLVYTGTFTVPAGNGTVTASVGAVDTAGNTLTATGQTGFTIDNTAPTVVLAYTDGGSSDATGPYKSGDSVTVTATYTETNALSGTPNQRPNLIANPYLKNGYQWLNPAAFAAPAPGTYGDLKANSLVGPGTFNVDMGLSRSFKAGKEREFQFRAEIFNLLNNTQLQNPVTALTASNFGLWRLRRSFHLRNFTDRICDSHEVINAWLGSDLFVHMSYDTPTLRNSESLAVSGTEIEGMWLCQHCEWS